MEETGVVLKKQTHIVDLVFEKSKSFLTDTEGITGVNLGVDSCHAKDVGVNNTCTKNFDPTFALAKTAAGTSAGKAGNIHLGAGFGEGEVVGTETNLGLRSEEKL